MTKAYTFDDIDSIEFKPALQIGDKVTFEHLGDTYVGTVDWLLSDGCVSIMVAGIEHPFMAFPSQVERVE